MIGYQMPINLVLLTSIIYVPNTPLSYIHTRSVFTPDERFTQTKKTIESIRKNIINAKICIVECSHLSEEQSCYFTSNCDYFINLIGQEEAKHNIYSMSKSLGEGTMTMAAIDFLQQNNIVFDHFFKITGRYWLSEKFYYPHFDNENAVVHYIQYDDNCDTSLYKLHNIQVGPFGSFLKSHLYLMHQCIGYEVLFAMFLKTCDPTKVVSLDKIGVNGYISVSNDYIDN